MSVRILPIIDGFAARVEGIDAALARAEDVACIKQAMTEFAVVVLPAQRLDEAAQVAFAQGFGPLETYAGTSEQYRRGMRAELLPISNTDDAGAPASPENFARLLDIGNKLWHTDSSFRAVPAHLSLLYGVEVTAIGGETQFADMRAAYDRLTADMKRLVGDLVAEHSVLHSRAMLGFDAWDADRRREAGAEIAHDIVRTLPETGRKSLYLSAHAGRILGLPVPIGRMLLAELTEIATAPDAVYSHRWRPGDLVIWDNRCTMHRLRRYDASATRRVLRRATTMDPAFPARDPDSVTVAPWVLAAA